MSKVSIIVPVYNIEEYLEKCVVSLMEQTYRNIEVLLIDDGSTDKSIEICDMLARKDKRVKVYHKTNGGLSEARNYGLDKCSGEYVMFVDGDDWIDRDTVEKSLLFMNEHYLDIVFFTYQKEYENQHVEVHVYDDDIICDNDKILRKRLFGLWKDELKYPEFADSLCSACMKLYKKSVIRSAKITFQPTRIIGSYEDGLFNLQIMKYADKVGYLNQGFYHYRKTNTNSLTSTYKSELIEQWNSLFDMINKSIIEENLEKEYKLRLQNRIVLSLIGIGLNELCSQKTGREKKEVIGKYIKSSLYKNAIMNIELRFFSIKWKMFFYAAKKEFVDIVYVLLIIMDWMRKRGAR